MYQKKWMKQNQESKEFIQGFRMLRRRIHSIKTVVQFAPKIPASEKRLLIALLNQNLNDCQRFLKDTNQYGGA